MTSILMLLVLALLSLQLQFVQTFLTQRVAKQLSKELHAEITVDHIYFRPFDALSLQGLRLRDPQGKVIAYVKHLKAYMSLQKIFQQEITIHKLQIAHAQVDLQRYDTAHNFQFLVDYFNRDNSAASSGKKMNIALQEVKLINNSFRYYDHRKKHYDRGIDYGDLQLHQISGTIKDISQKGQLMDATLENIRFNEQRGLQLQELSAKASLSDTHLAFDDLQLRTNRSTLTEYVRFDFQQWKHFEQFVDSVQVSARLKNSFIHAQDIEFFAPQLKGVFFAVNLQKASLKGTVSSFRAKDVLLSTAKNTVLAGDIGIQGLPNIEHTIFDINLQKLSATADDAQTLVRQLSANKTFTLPAQLLQLGTLTYTGQLSGKYYDFHLLGAAHTALGTLNSDSHIKLRNSLSYLGRLHSQHFQLGKLLNIQQLGSTAVDLHFDGAGNSWDNLQMELDGDLNGFHYDANVIDHIRLESTFAQQLLRAKGNITDPKALLTFEAQVDWSSALPSYALQTQIDQLNLRALNLWSRDSLILQHTYLETEFQGNTLNTITGNLRAQDLQLKSSKGAFNIDVFQFHVQDNNLNKEIVLESDVAYAKLIGKIDVNTIVPYFKSLAMRYAPAIALDTPGFNTQNFDLTVHIKSFQPLAALFDPSLTLDDGATLKATFSSDDFTAHFKAFSPSLTYKGMRLTNISIEENADEQAFALVMHADRFQLSDSTYIQGVKISNILANDRLNFNIRLADTLKPNFLRLDGNIHFEHNKPAYIQINSSDIVLNNSPWQLHPNSQLRVSKGKIFIDQLTLNQEKQQVDLTGVMSNSNDQLKVRFSEFDLGSFAGITKPKGILLEGALNGNIAINSVFKNPQMSANIRTSPIRYNDMEIGSFMLNADYQPNEELVQVEVALQNELQQGFQLAGTYNLAAAEQALNLKGQLHKTNLRMVQPFLKSLATGIEGQVSGDVHISGTLQRPSFSGLATLNQTAFQVNYLKTAYHLDGQSIMVDKNAFLLNNLKFQDLKKSTATANGILDLKKITDPYIDIDVAAENFMVLNTTAKDNDLYYGQIFASGRYRFKGPTSAIAIDIQAQSNAQSTITIPFNSAMKINESDFIYFVTADSLKHQKSAARKNFRGVAMNMDLRITPEVSVNLENNLGSLKGVGEGNLNLRISTLGDFEMFGGYHVNTGKFHFTAQDFINKYFDIKEGGTVRWAGEPAEAVINLNAIYQQRTSIAPLYNAAARTEKTDRVLAQADLYLKGTLSQPEISFGLNFPQDPYINDELQGYLSDINNVNQQALSLIIRRNFASGSTQELGREVNNTLLSAGTEIAFNQLNTIISQSLNMNFFDLNIKSFNDASASLRFFDDRLVFTGGVSDRSQLRINDLNVFSDKVATDAELTFKLRKEGNLILRAYNRLNTKNFLFNPYDDYISAAGLVYRQEFNSLSDFWRKLWIRSLKNQNPKPTASTKVETSK